MQIWTQGIFDDLIKQNQKLRSDSVPKQTMTVAVSRAQCTECSVQRLKSSAQSPTSNFCVQSPGILVSPKSIVQVF